MLSLAAWGPCICGHLFYHFSRNCLIEPFYFTSHYFILLVILLALIELILEILHSWSCDLKIVQTTGINAGFICECMSF